MRPLRGGVQQVETHLLTVLLRANAERRHNKLDASPGLLYTILTDLAL